MGNYEKIRDLFDEYFASWAKDVLKMLPSTENEIEIFMKDGRRYRFGQRGNEVYLESVKPEKR